MYVAATGMQIIIIIIIIIIIENLYTNVLNDNKRV